MTRSYGIKTLLTGSFALLLLMIASCKKDHITPSNTPTNYTPGIPTKFGLYEADSSIYRLLYTYVSKIGNLDVSNKNYDLVFDTGSGGLVIDADGILPPSMITSTGFNFTGDSTVVNGITIYDQKSTIVYGDDANTTNMVYGNLAYANVTIGDAKGKMEIKRLPFFLYYKAVDGHGTVYTPHEFDVFGVSSEYDVTFSNGAYITSPFSYFDPGPGLTRGFKMAALGTNNFSYQGTYVPGVVTLGLTPADLAPGNFTMHQLGYRAGDGYAPIIPASLSYNSNKSFKTTVIFDTGTEPYSYIQDPKAANSLTLLPANSNISLSSNAGFNYSYYISASDNLTYVENPSNSLSTLTVISLEFFLDNEYLLDFANHRLGVKNN